MQTALLISGESQTSVLTEGEAVGTLVLFLSSALKMTGLTPLKTALVSETQTCITAFHTDKRQILTLGVGKLILEPRFHDFHSDLCESAQFVADTFQLRWSERYSGRDLVPDVKRRNQCLFGVEFGYATGVTSRCGAWSFRKLGMIPGLVEKGSAGRCWNQ